MELHKCKVIYKMNNKRITRLPLPNVGDEAATKNYVSITMNHLPNLFLDRQGASKMLGKLQMNNHRIIHQVVMMKQQIKNTLMKIVQKVVLNHLILQKMCFNISWMM